MKKAIICGIVISVILMSCTKNVSAWLGTYNGSAGNNTVNRIIIGQASGSSVQMQLQTTVLGAYYTYVTIQNAVLTTPYSATINEDGTIYGYSGTYHFSGTATLNGNALTVQGSAVNGSSSIPYYFTGSK